MNKEAVLAIFIIVPLFFILTANQRWISDQLVAPLDVKGTAQQLKQTPQITYVNPHELVQETYETANMNKEAATPAYEDPAAYEAVLTPVDEYWLEEGTESSGEAFAQKD